jgi:hypothetical protein
MDIPVEALAVVSAYLPKPSRALFAVAMTKTAHSTSHVQAILGRDWTTLDFGDVDRSLASRLSDDDLSAVLTCIYANFRLRTLKLTGCFNLTGAGLEPLRFSTVLEQIDLSIVNPLKRIDERGIPVSLSENYVIPILRSIINSDGSSFKHLQLPKAFRSRQSRILDEFIDDANEILEEKGDICNCRMGAWGNADGGGNAWIIDNENDPHYGLQNYTCYKCTNHFCTEYDCVVRCIGCERMYCTDCVKFVECGNCSTKLCNECIELRKCDSCGQKVCDDCFDDFDRGRCLYPCMNHSEDETSCSVVSSVSRILSYGTPQPLCLLERPVV